MQGWSLVDLPIKDVIEGQAGRVLGRLPFSFVNHKEVRLLRIV